MLVCTEQGNHHGNKKRALRAQSPLPPSSLLYEYLHTSGLRSIYEYPLCCPYVLLPSFLHSFLIATSSPHVLHSNSFTSHPNSSKSSIPSPSFLFCERSNNTVWLLRRPHYNGAHKQLTTTIQYRRTHPHEFQLTASERYPSFARCFVFGVIYCCRFL